MTLALDNPAKPHLKRWTKCEYNDSVDRGLFANKRRMFLYRGELVEMPPMGSLHALGLMNVSDWLNDVFRPEFRVRIQMPFETPGESMPEPDAAIVSREQMVRRPHPNAALLVVEVSDSSLELDHEKAFEYAAAQVPEYWIVNMAQRLVEVYRNPIADSAAVLGCRYVSHQVHGENETISSLLRPEVSVAVSKLVALE